MNYVSGYGDGGEFGQSEELMEEHDLDMPLTRAETELLAALRSDFETDGIDAPSRKRLVRGIRTVARETRVDDIDVCPLLAAARVNDVQLAKALLSTLYPGETKLMEVVSYASARHHLRFVDELLADPRNRFPDLVDVATMRGDVDAVGVLKNRGRVSSERLRYLRIAHHNAVSAWLLRMKTFVASEKDRVDEAV